MAVTMISAIKRFLDVIVLELRIKWLNEYGSGRGGNNGNRLSKGSERQWYKGSEFQWPSDWGSEL